VIGALVASAIVGLSAAPGRPVGSGRRFSGDTARVRLRFQAELDRLARQEGFPGATAAALLPDGRIIGAATGMADKERRIPMRPDTRMLGASIGKMFVAATALSLVHEGALDLDAPIGRWLEREPWFPRLQGGEAMTLRMLLSHAAGVGNHYRDTAFTEAWARGRRVDPDYAPPPRELIEYVLDRPPQYPLGMGYSYTDTGYLLVGLIIENATGQRYYDLVARRFLRPLGLRATGPSDRRLLRGLAAGYSAPDNRFHLPEKGMAGGRLVWNPAIEWTGGGLVTNSMDLVRWAGALFGGRALPPAALAEMLAGLPDNPAREPEGSRYALGVRIADTPLGVYYGHGGSIPGYRSYLAYYPDRKAAVAIQLNTDAPPYHDRIATTYLPALAKVVLDDAP
jgi:D-alanyl-D-alanine carboxypeptidase